MNGLALELSVSHLTLMDSFDTKVDTGFLNLVDLYRNFFESDFLFSQISTNAPYLTSVIATLRVTISTDHTNAPVTGATLEMDVHVKVPSNLDLLAQFCATLTRTRGI